MAKRIIDFVLALIGLVILFPFFLLISVWIKLDSKGPIFYLQERVGKDRKIFRLFKFRTMRMHADKLTAITVGMRDPRITRLGFYLRKYKIDELPQLINVWLGSMSLVGPRPEIKKFVDLYTSEQLQVLSVKPGMTDFASIAFRNENDLLDGKEDPVDFYIREIMPQKLSINLQYIREQSLLVDFKIMVQTVFAIFKKA